MSKYLIVNTEVANIYRTSSFNSELVTQALLWEKLIVMDKKDSWFKIKQWDGYIGWIHQFYITNHLVYEKYKLDDEDKWYIIKERLVKIVDYNKKNKKYLSIGTVIPIIKKDNNIFTLVLPNEREFLIDKKYLCKYETDRRFEDIIPTAYNLISTPYLWGGKSGFGFDCSGLVQLLFRLVNIEISRDTKDQVLSQKIKKIVKPQVGDIVFFEKNDQINHVGLFVNDSDYIHSSGCVKINSINSKSDNFDKKLFSSIYTMSRISK